MHASIFRIHLEIYETFIHEHLAPLALKKKQGSYKGRANLFIRRKDVTVFYGF